MKKQILLLTAIGFCFSIAYTQKSGSSTHQSNLDPAYQSAQELKSFNKWDKVSGTFQFQINNADYHILLNDDMYNLILVSRKEFEDATIKIDDFTELFLPSKKRIDSENYLPLDPIKYTSK